MRREMTIGRCEERAAWRLVEGLEPEPVALIDPPYEAPKTLGLPHVVPESVVETHVGQPVPIASVNRCECHLTHRLG